MKELVRIYYLKILYFYFKFVLRLVNNKSKIYFIDFDFTLAIHHDFSKKNKRWDLSSSQVNLEVINILNQEHNWVLFTARGIRSYRELMFWLAKKNLKPIYCIFLGSTKNKIKFIRNECSNFDEVIWVDDLCDFDHVTKNLIYHEVLDLPTNINLIRIPCTYLNK